MLTLASTANSTTGIGMRNFDKPLPNMPEMDDEFDGERGEFASRTRVEAHVSEKLCSWVDEMESNENCDAETALSERWLSVDTDTSRPRAPTPTSAPQISEDNLSPATQSYVRQMNASARNLDISFDSPVSPILPSMASSLHNSPDLRSPSSENDSTSALSHSFASSQKLPAFIDVSQFPDPYPFRPPHHHLTSTTPALSSAGSSSASTRSSAYTSSGSALASSEHGHGHVRVASGDSGVLPGVGITSDDVVQLLASQNSSSSAVSGSQEPLNKLRWSGNYSAESASHRVSASRVANATNDYDAVAELSLHKRPSYDMSWRPVPESDEAELTSEEDSEIDAYLRGGEDDGEDEDQEEERTAAIVIAEEGRGLIIKGDGAAVSDLHVPSGTTHMLVGSSSTPNAMPAFLTSALPLICTTLLALDISANFLGALPPVLASCYSLEELNIASNPLRVLPVFLSELSNLRVLIADATGISTIPESFNDLEKMHTLSVRRNKLHSLPSWLCLLVSLQTLYVDGNPFQGPWKALVEPLLAKSPMTPSYPPSTPIFPPPASDVTSVAGGDTDIEDILEEKTDSPAEFKPDEEDTITPARASHVGRSATEPVLEAAQTKQGSRPALARTRTTPSRAYYDKSRANKGSRPGTATTTQSSFAVGPPNEKRSQVDSGYFGEREVRRMKSAGELRAGRLPASTNLVFDLLSTPTTPSLPRSIALASSSNVSLAMPQTPGTPMTPMTPEIPLAKRFASLGVASSSSLNVASGSSFNVSDSRPAIRSLWDSPDKDDMLPPSHSRRPSVSSSSPSPPRPIEKDVDGDDLLSSHARARSSRTPKEKNTRWGFLKKMSMGKLRSDPPTSRPSTMHARPGPMLSSIDNAPGKAGLSQSLSAPAGLHNHAAASPHIDIRISTIGSLDHMLREAPGIGVSPSIALSPSVTVGNTIQEESPLPESSLKVPSVPSAVSSSSSLLVPPSPVSRPGRRRSFLPLDPHPLTLTVPGSLSSEHLPQVSTPTNVDGSDGFDESRRATPSPVLDPDYFIRKEEEKAREAYTRALRSVMAYLKDMNDLTVTQQPPPTSMYSSVIEDFHGGSLGSVRSRRPTLAEGGRMMSEYSLPSASSSVQPRSTEYFRAGDVAQTNSVATTDSSGSNEERKYKDDKGKRAMVIREIVETERTYVKGLQELVDIYIKPAAAPVNIMGGVGSGKDTVLPATERKVVFNGVDSLFSFHKENFLPALERAASPVLGPSIMKGLDVDGQLSLNVARAVASIFLKHAAFMKMYSSYINNFDSSLQRVKHWVSDRPSASGGASSALPASSSGALVGLGLSMSAVSTPGMMADGSLPLAHAVTLSSAQRKRIRTYLKRCRMNPRHSQLNLEGYLLLPVQRIPRYKLLLEELLRSTPPTYELVEDPLEKALAEISSLASNMNEGKRESESRRKLVQWQARIRGKFPSPLVQPHRRLIMDGPLLLTRLVRKTAMSFEAFTAQGDMSTVQVDCLAPELTPRKLMGILCNDLLVLCRDPSEGRDPASAVDLWAVLRMQTLPQPASIVHGNVLRLVDNKAILYFEAPSPSEALNWFRAINLHIPASKT